MKTTKKSASNSRRPPRQVGVTLDSPVLLDWADANRHLDRAIERGLECCPNYADGPILQRFIKLNAIYSLRLSKNNNVDQLKELELAVQIAFRLERQISHAVGFKNPAPVSIETLVSATSDLNWIATHLETVYDRVLSSLAVGWQPEGDSSNERS